MAEIHVEWGLHEPLLNSNGMSANYWYATAIIDGSPHTDAAAPTLELVLASLATKLAEHIETHERIA